MPAKITIRDKISWFVMNRSSYISKSRQIFPNRIRLKINFFLAGKYSSEPFAPSSMSADPLVYQIAPGVYAAIIAS